ncbi:hypothetical protein BH09BAC6_BH09BAC6_25070 [soil metagenome]
MKKIFLAAISITIIGSLGCKKNVIKQVYDTATGAKVKFVQASPGTPAVDFFVGGVRINPVLNSSVTDNGKVTSIATGLSYSSANNANTYAGAFPANDYALVKAGSTEVKITTATPTPALVSPQTIAPGTNFFTATQNFENNKSYSVFAAGLPDQISGLIVEDKFPAADTGVAYVRLVQLIPNASTAVDVSGTYTPTGGTATTTSLISNVAFKSVSDFKAIKVNKISTTAYTFQLYLTGTTTTLGSSTVALNLTPGRFYTLIARGLAADYTVPGSGIVLKAKARPSDNVNNKIPEIYFNPPGLSYYVNK